MNLVKCFVIFATLALSTLAMPQFGAGPGGPVDGTTTPFGNRRPTTVTVAVTTACKNNCIWF